MAGRKFEAGEKKVQKMSREGLTEKNLHTGESISISRNFDGAVSERMDGSDEQPTRIRAEIDGSGEKEVGSRKRRRQQRMKNAEPMMEVSALGQQPGTVQEETIARASPSAVMPEPSAVPDAIEQPSYQAAEVEHSRFPGERQHDDLNREPYNTGQPMEAHFREQHRQGMPESGERSVIEEPVQGKEAAFSEKSFQETETLAAAEPVREKKVALATELPRETEPTLSGESIREKSAVPAVEKSAVTETQDRLGSFSESILERGRDREELYEAEPAEVENRAINDAEGNTRLKSHSVRMDRMGKGSETPYGKAKRRKSRQRQSRKFQGSENESLKTKAVQNVADDLDFAKPIQAFEVDTPSGQVQGNMLRPQEVGFHGSVALQDTEALTTEVGMSMVSSTSKSQHFQRGSEGYRPEVNDGDTPMESENQGGSSGKYSLQTHSARFQAVSGQSARSSELPDTAEVGSNHKRRIGAETVQISSEDADRVGAPSETEATRSPSQEILQSKPLLLESTGDAAPLQNASDVPALPKEAESARSVLQETTNLPVPVSTATDIVTADSGSIETRPEGLDFDGKSSLKQHSGRLDNYRESYSRNGDSTKSSEESHERKKAQTQDYQRKAERASSEERKSSGKRSDAFQKEEGKPNPDGKTGKKSRLSFDDEQTGMVRGAGMGLGKKAVKGAVTTTSGYVHKKIYEVEQENSGVKAAHRTELVAEGGVSAVAHKLSNRSKVQKQSNRQQRKEEESGKSSRLNFTDAEKEEGATPGAKKKADKNSRLPAVKAQIGSEVSVSVSGKEAVEESKKKNAVLNRFWQKRRYKEAYIAAREGLTVAAPETAKATQTVTGKVKQIVQSFTKDNKGLLAGVAIFALLFILIATCLSSCTAMFQGVQDSFVSTTYPSTDDDIYAVENAYVALETALNSQINNMETTHPGYDEYRYQVDEISHNPYQLISYLTVLYGEFTYSQVAGILEDLFSQQYTLNVSEEVEIRTRTETRTGTTTSTDPETGETTEEEYEYEVEVEYEYYILNISLVNHGFDTVAQSNLTDDQVSLYTLYNATYGNRSYLFDTETLSTYTGSTGSSSSSGFGYTVSAEALSDEKFARMIAEAEKYLGYPYVWGGSSPSTSFDCSGFVCWVINNCGNGWNVGRTTAEGLRSYCSYVSPEDAQPGDLIFFQGTYSTSGASHVGIYVGNGMMIHCGNPIQYTSAQTTYWQSHFLAYGRIN
ncbi:MAG: NlpC/P60 family protein [Lachnospiraceae bacterium]|nr:NlpC/P60 family protein [Lachnospiraceae bacterium]